jgi:hypothetical protein
MATEKVLNQKPVKKDTSLRDHFAGLALQALLTRIGGDPAVVAAKAAMYADALVAELHDE